MYSHQTQLVHAAQKQQEEQRVRDEQRRQQERRIQESFTPGTSAYRQRTCIDSASDAVNNCYCGPKDTKLGKVARGLCGLSVASVATGICGMGTGVLPYEVGYSLGYAGMAGCGITSCVGHSSKFVTLKHRLLMRNLLHSYNQSQHSQVLVCNKQVLVL